MCVLFCKNITNRYVQKITWVLAYFIITHILYLTETNLWKPSLMSKNKLCDQDQYTSCLCGMESEGDGTYLRYG